MSYPPPPEPDPTVPMPGYPSAPDPAPYAPGKASVPSYPPGYVGEPQPPGPQPYQPGQHYPQPNPPGPARRPWLIVGVIVAAVLALLCAGGAVVAVIALRDNSTATGPSGATVPSADPVTQPTAPGQPTTPAQPTPTDEPGPTTTSGENDTFNMDIGDTAVITKGANEWRVTVTAMTWRDNACGGIVPPDGRLLLVDITFEVVTGRASINPLYFSWSDANGATEEAFSGMLSGCNEPRLDAAVNLRAGTKRTGRITFDVTGATKGTIVYDDFFGPHASWVAPAP